MQAIAAFFLLLTPLLILAGPIYPVCSLASTSGQFFLSGPCDYSLAATACITAGGVLASIFEHTRDDAAMLEYLKIRRGLRKCGNILNAWVNDKGIVGKTANDYILPPPMRVLTIKGMRDGQLSDISKEYMALCVIPE